MQGVEVLSARFQRSSDLRFSFLLSIFLFISVLRVFLCGLEDDKLWNASSYIGLYTSSLLPPEVEPPKARRRSKRFFFATRCCPASQVSLLSASQVSTVFFPRPGQIGPLEAFSMCRDCQTRFAPFFRPPAARSTPFPMDLAARRRRAYQELSATLLSFPFSTGFSVFPLSSPPSSFLPTLSMPGSRPCFLDLNRVGPGSSAEKSRKRRDASRFPFHCPLPSRLNLPPSALPNSRRVLRRYPSIWQWKRITFLFFALRPSFQSVARSSRKIDEKNRSHPTKQNKRVKWKAERGRIEGVVVRRKVVAR